MIDPRLRSIVGKLAQEKATPPGAPSVEQVRLYLATCFAGAERWAGAFHKAMTEQHWQDREHKAITNWRAMARAYASKAFLSK